MFGRSLCALGVLFGVWMGVAPAGAVELRVWEETIAFEPGARHCALDEAASEVDYFLLDWQRKSNRGLNDVIAIFAECQNLEEIRAGLDVSLEDYGVLLAPLTEGRPLRMPGYTRAGFLREALEALGGGIEIDQREISRRLDDALGPVLREELGSASVEGVRQLGVLHVDEAAIYYGILGRYTVGGRSFSQAGVLSMTLVKERMLQYTLYREYEDKSTFATLLAEARPIMQDLVRRNGPGTE